jgi:hypothetical protein
MVEFCLKTREAKLYFLNKEYLVATVEYSNKYSVTFTPVSANDSMGDKIASISSSQNERSFLQQSTCISSVAVNIIPLLGLSTFDDFNTIMHNVLAQRLTSILSKPLLLACNFGSTIAVDGTDLSDAIGSVATFIQKLIMDVR